MGMCKHAPSSSERCLLPRVSSVCAAFQGTFGAELPGKYIDDLVANWPNRVQNYTQVPDSVSVYRAVLARERDSSVTIASIGFMTNLAALLRSSADRHSRLNGVELVAAKVKEIVVMGGKYPSSDGQKVEWNFGGGGDVAVAAGTASFALQHMPPNVRLVFAGFEVGSDIWTGAKLSSCASVDSPCRQAYIDLQGLNKARESWDPLTTLVGVRGVNASQYALQGQGGLNVVNASTGHNHWQFNVSGKLESAYLVLFNAEKAAIAAEIDELLCRPPKARLSISGGGNGVPVPTVAEPVTGWVALACLLSTTVAVVATLVIRRRHRAEIHTPIIDQ
jgi:hypothetical protein